MSAVAPTRGRVWLVATAVASSVLCGSLMSASASVSSGDRSVYVPITPCRVMDTRPAPDNVGARTAPLIAQETHTISVLGANGQCTLPLDANAVTMNVTAVNPTDASYLTVFPADAERPLASSVNWVAQQGATPNAVTSDISADGRVSFFNNAGSVDVIADIVGYFVGHDHDDRYYTEAEIDAKLAAKLDATPGAARVLVLGVSDFQPYTNEAGVEFVIDPVSNIITNLNGNLCFIAPVHLPDGATITKMVAYGLDLSPTLNFAQTLIGGPLGNEVGFVAASTVSAGTPGAVVLEDTTIQSAVIDSKNLAYTVRVCLDVKLAAEGAKLEYTMPS